MEQPARPNVLDAACGSRRVLEMVSDTWTVLVIYALGEQPLRYRQIQQRVDGISDKMLTQTLRKLERRALVFRRPHLGGHTADYELTALGRSLLADALQQLCGWAQQHLDDVGFNSRPQAAPLTDPDAP